MHTKMRISTEKRKELFLACYKKKGCNISKACVAADIHRRTFYLWIETDKNFSQLVEDTEESLYDNVESLIIDKMFNQKDTKMIIHFSKTKMKHRGYVEQQEIIQAVQNVESFEEAYRKFQKLKLLQNEK